MATTAKKSKKKIIIFSAIIVVILIVGGIVLFGSKKEQVFSIETEKVARRTITQTVTATGKIYPEVQVVISPEVSGEVIALPVKEGMRVRRGDLLMKIKPDTYIAMRDRANAGLTSAKANLTRSESEHKRANELFAKGLISDSELEAAKTSFEVTKAAYDQSAAALKQSNEDLYKTTINSPMDGTISALQIELGERVLGTSQFQGTNVMTVADLSRMEARVDVGENDVILISIGDTTRIEVDAIPDRKLTGVVYEIANSAKTKGAGTQEEVTNFEVKIRILDKDVVLRPGMSMTATIETETRLNVLSVPVQSVTTRSPKKMEGGMQGGGDGGDAMAADQPKTKQKAERPKEVVFVVDNNAVKAIEVKRGISDDQYTEIVTGIDEGKEVVSGSYKAINRELEDGAKIRVEKDKKKPDTKTTGQ
jgi:HlyD family secretion protein